MWTPTQARRVFAYTKSLGGRIAAAEFMNEPNFAAMGGAPPGYDAAAYARARTRASWASSFTDTFRYLDQLGRTAKQGVQVVAHNTLVASDYGMLDEHDFTPKPYYWGALRWRRLMGSTVLDSGVPMRAGLQAYAHCLRDKPGGVALLLINTDRAAAQTVTLPVCGERYTLTSPDAPSRRVDLNGSALTLGAGDALPNLAGVRAAAGDVTLAPGSITFLAVPVAGNSACR